MTYSSWHEAKTGSVQKFAENARSDKVRSRRAE